jgi:hypothetical protein
MAFPDQSSSQSGFYFFRLVGTKLWCYYVDTYSMTTTTPTYRGISFRISRTSSNFRQLWFFILNGRESLDYPNRMAALQGAKRRIDYQKAAK